MPAQTDAQRQKAHRKRTKERLARLERYEKGLRDVVAITNNWATRDIHRIAREALATPITQD